MPTLLSSLLAFWPAAIAVLTVAGAGASFSVASPQPWRSIGRFAILFGFLGCLALALWEASIPGYNRLARDTVAFALIGSCAPALSYACAFGSRPSTQWVRIALSLVAGVLPLLASPLLLLLVHCTSGDCL